jgi:hypothetical protein
VALLCAALLAPGDLTTLAQSAQQPAAAEAPTKIPNDQLDSLVAPIALYPDPLLSQTLVASTYPLEIVQLQQWLERNKNLKDKALADAVKKQGCDPSIQAMAALPDVVKRLADDIKWTTDLGNAFLAQQSDVMDAVQRMRTKAQDTGNLKSNEQQKVETKVVESKQVVVIEQANPQVVYVPSYNPTVVYGPPVYPYPPIYYPPWGYYAAGIRSELGWQWEPSGAEVGVGAAAGGVTTSTSTGTTTSTATPTSTTAATGSIPRGTAPATTNGNITRSTAAVRPTQIGAPPTSTEERLAETPWPAGRPMHASGKVKRAVAGPRRALWIAAPVAEPLRIAGVEAETASATAAFPAVAAPLAAPTPSVVLPVAWAGAPREPAVQEALPALEALAAEAVPGAAAVEGGKTIHDQGNPHEIKSLEHYPAARSLPHWGSNPFLHVGHSLAR